MSNAPDQPWPPPSAAVPGPSIGWRILHSWWLLVPILGFSCLGGFGFLYVGVRARRPAWWIPGIVYSVVGWTAFIVVGESEETSALSDWGVGVVLAVWLGSILHAALINPSWLRWRAGYRPWHAQPPPAPIYPGQAYPAAPPVAYYGSGPVAAAVPSEVDVNAAGVGALAALPGFDAERARRVVAERDARRGFGSVAEFAAVADLAPHEYARLRGVLVCGGAPRAPGPYPGRVLDV